MDAAPAGGGEVPGWDVFPAGPGAAAIAPTDDVLEHQLAGPRCPCEPQAVPVTRADGAVGWLYVHNRLDGREGPG